MDIYTVLAHYSARPASGKEESEGAREEAWKIKKARTRRA
ncbi:hypothetical protein BN129_1757 [Cronobacter sakazakii 701]|nr:hypothetical protein BN129_1757 [Cronobacter sakazakii 701]